MAISDTQKVDYLWKKLGYGSTKTDTNANKLAPNEAIASPLILRGDKVWQQASSIPTVQPGSSSGVVTVYPTSGPQECTEDITATANRSWKTGLTDWIPPEIGSTYQAKVYIHTSGDAAGASGGDQVFATGSGNDDEWFFDYQSGVLHFIGTNLPDGISFTGKSVYVAGARYTGAFGVGSAGGEVGNIGNLQVDDTTFTSVTASDDIIIDAESGVFKISGTTGFVIPVGNTAQRDGSPDTGLTRYNSETGLLEIYDGSSWESMGDYAATVDSFDGDNSTTAFTMSAESTTDGTIVDINGVVQLPTTAYSVSGNVITFTQAPASGDKITTRLLVSLVGTTAQAAGSDTQVQFNDGDVLAGDSGFTYNKTANALTVSGNLTVNEITIPGVDGTAGQALLTYGNGVTYFGNVASSGLGNIVEDTTPQLGGDLDLNSNDINGSGNVNVTGNISATTTITATGNVTGGNLITGAQVVATGNVTGGNLVTSADVTTATVTATGNISVGGILLADVGTHEKFSSLANATSTVTHDCSNGHIFYHTTPSANFTANFTNLNLGNTYATTTTLVMIQGATARIANAVQIGGSSETINWQGGSEPTGTNNGIDVITFSILNNAGTYTVLGQLVDF